MSNSNMISTVFGRERPTIISDSVDFTRACATLGFKVATISTIRELPKASIVFSFSNDAAKLTFDIARNTIDKKSIFCAVQVFEPSVESALYSLNLLLMSDFEKALSTQRTVLNMLNSNADFVLLGKDVDAQVSVHSHGEPYALIAEDVEHNFVQSVAEFFEVHYAHMNPDVPCPFSFSGSVKVAGILTVLRRHDPSISESLKAALIMLRERVAEEGAVLIVRDNIVTSFTTGHEEHVGLLADAAGSRGLMLTEFAIGVNSAVSSCIDYKINSQMNEGVSGVHVAIGDGSSGYHIDFLCPDVSVSPVPKCGNGG